MLLCFVHLSLPSGRSKATPNFFFVHQHKPRQSKRRGNQNLRANSAKYWTLNVPIQHPHKKATGRKTREKHIAAQKKNNTPRKAQKQERDSACPSEKRQKKGTTCPKNASGKLTLKTKTYCWPIILPSCHSTTSSWCFIFY